MIRTRFLGAVLVIFGLVAGAMLLLVDASRAQFAERRAELARDGVRIEPLEVWVRNPSRSDQPTRLITYRFQPGPGEPVDGADPVPIDQVAALMAQGRPTVVYLRDRPQVNALEATLGQAAAPRARGLWFWLLAGVAGGLVAGGVALLARRRPAA